MTDASLNGSTPAVDPAAVLNEEDLPAAKIHAKLQDLEAPIVTNRPAKFYFKEVKDAETDEVIKAKRPTVELMLPQPTFEGMVAALSDEKQREFVLEIVWDAIVFAARQQVNDEANPVSSQAELDVSKLTLEFLANIEKVERRGGGISKDTWEEFAKDYLAVMPGVTNKDPAKIGNAVKIMVGRFQQVKTALPILRLMQEQLALWFTSTARAEEFQEVYDYLNKRATDLLNVKDEDLLANL